MSTKAFLQLGNTITFTAATVAPTPVQVTSTAYGTAQYRILNAGTNTVFLGYAMTSSVAAANAVIVTSSQPSVPLLPGTDEILTLSPNAYFTGITQAGTSTIYITPGEGL